MKPIRLTSALFCFTFVSMLPLTGTAAQRALARSYRAPDDLAPWRGQVESIRTSSNYLLTAYSPALTNAAGEHAYSVARLQADGSLDGAVSSWHGDQGVITFRTHPSEALVYCKLEGMADEEFWTDFGVFNARDGQRIFEFGVPVSVDGGGPGSYAPDPFLSVDYLTDGRSTVLMTSNGGVIRLAVLDKSGKPQWEKAFWSGSFGTTATRGLNASLIEKPGDGFWLLVQGSLPISTEPNPPAVNTALTLSILRLSASGDVRWTRKLTGLLTGSGILTLGPAAMGRDGTLILPLSDAVIDTSGAPTLIDLSTYLIALDPDGAYQWCRRISRTFGVTPLLSPSQDALFVVGARPKSLLPTFNAENFILRLVPATGELVAQTAIDSSAATGLNAAGIAGNRLFFSASGPYPPAPSKAYIGSFDLQLRSSTWREYALNDTASFGLLLDASKRSLLFFDTPVSGGQVDALRLDLNLDPLSVADGEQPPASPCQFLSATTLPFAAFQSTVDKISLSPSSLWFMLTKDTDVPLIPTTRIQFRAIQPKAEDLCPATSGVTPQLVIKPGGVRAGLNLSFQSEPGKTYEVIATETLGQPFRSLQKLMGDGGRMQCSIPAGKEGSRFFSLQLVGP